MAREEYPHSEPRIGGIVGWLIATVRGKRRTQARLELVERIALAPRQSLALVEAEGRRILVATSAEGGPAFYPLDEGPGIDEGMRTDTCRAARTAGRRQVRISW